MYIMINIINVNLFIQIKLYEKYLQINKNK
jgi:hypothetical protein